MKKHSWLTGNQHFMVTHNFWVLILMTHVQYGNRNQKLHPRSLCVQHSMDFCVRETVVLKREMNNAEI